VCVRRAERRRQPVRDLCRVDLAFHGSQDRRALIASDGSLHDLAQRPVGDALAVRDAAARECRDALRPGRELARQPRLADPGRPEHPDDPDALRLDRLTHDRPQRGELASAADERGVEAALEGGRRAGGDVDEAVSAVHGLDQRCMG